MSASPGRVSPTASRAGLTLCGAVILLALYGALYPPAPTERSPPKTVAVQFNPGGRDIDPDVPNALYIHRYSEKPTRPLGMAVDPRDNPSAWFADWELASMAASQGAWGICKPPAGIPESCCIGATSRGGSVGWRNWDCTDADNHFKVLVPGVPARAWFAAQLNSPVFAARPVARTLCASCSLPALPLSLPVHWAHRCFFLCRTIRSSGYSCLGL